MIQDAQDQIDLIMKFKDVKNIYFLQKGIISVKFHSEPKRIHFKTLLQVVEFAEVKE